jgi:formylmethanofuran dehydrogenase subunit C
MPLHLSIRTHTRAGSAPFRSVSLAGLAEAINDPSRQADPGDIPILCDGRPAKLANHFDVAGDLEDGVVQCSGDFSRVHFLGAGLSRGAICVTGDVGRHAGEGMTGGRLQITGSAGDWLACGMAGGEVHVGGDAGDNAAAALPGCRAGMTGGRVVIRGSVGAVAGSRMRRGLLAIGGSCGVAAGFELLAGTVVVAGQAGRHAGLGMQRGSIILLEPTATPETAPASLPPAFRRGNIWRPAFLPLLGRHLAHAGFDTADEAVWAGLWQQWHGDNLCGGRGELLVPVRPSA